MDIKAWLIGAISILSTFGEAIPSARLPIGGWAPGIPGGIPTDYTQFCNVRVSIPGTNILAVGDGVADDSTAINTALALSPQNSYVYLPTGRYNVSGTGVRFPYGAQKKTLRGAGPTNTVIHSATASSIIVIEKQSGYAGWQLLTADTPAGSTNIAVVNASDFVIGEYALLLIENDTNSLTFGATPSYMGATESQLVKVTSKSGNTLGIDRGVYIDYVTSRSAQMARYWTGMPLRCGIEDLGVQRTANSGLHNIYFGAAAECWVKNVESIKVKKWHVRFDSSVRCEVRDSYLHDGWDGGGDSSYGVGFFQWTTDCLAENNIFELLRHSMILEWGGMGNVFGYNWSFNPVNENYTSTDYLMGDTSSHGGIPRFNLWEGNVTAAIRFDNILGGSDKLTVYRSQIQRKGLPSTTVANHGLDVQRANLYASVVGSVFEAPPVGSSAPLYRFGSTDDNVSNLDSNVTNTIYLHGLYNFVDATTTWASTNADHTLPASYYKVSEPTWWNESPWPPIGPDVSGFTNTLPAMEMHAIWGSVSEDEPESGMARSVSISRGSLTSPVTLR